MMDIQLLKDQLTGIEAKGKELRAKEKLFLKLSGIDEEIEKAKKDLIECDEKTEALKTKKTGLIQKKNTAVQQSIKGITEKMAEVLPEGMSVFRITDDGNLVIGWDYNGSFRAYEGLSGGEKVQFDLSLAHALNAGILIMEAAEADDDSLAETMAMLSQVDKMIIINTCHPPKETPGGWTHIELSK